jgi:hypothetical protein
MHSKYHVKNTIKDSYMTTGKKREMRRMMLPIFSQDNNAFQMDTFENNHKSTQPKYFLIMICINSRKAYAYPMKNKNKESVLQAIQNLINDRKNEGRSVSSFYTDEDTAYTSNLVIEFLEKNNIELHTTDEQHNHTNLALINRLIRTLRDMNGNNKGEYNISGEVMTELINDYNSTPHSSTGIAPNEMNEKDMDLFKEEQKNKSDIKKSIYHLFEGEKVRALQDWKPFEKKRYNLSREYMKVDTEENGGYLLSSKDQSVSQYPRWMLENEIQEEVPEKEEIIIKGKKRYVMKQILIYDSKNKKYYIEWDDGTKSWETMRNIRRGNPTKKTPLEQEFWNNPNSKVI